MKLAARVGTSGIDAELGLSRRFSPTSVVYAGTVLGYSSGTQFKLRYSRAGQVRDILSLSLGKMPTNVTGLVATLESIDVSLLLTFSPSLPSAR